MLFRFSASVEKQVRVFS